MRKYVASFLIFAQVITLTPAWGVRGKDGLTERLLENGGRTFRRAASEADLSFKSDELGTQDNSDIHPDNISSSFTIPDQCQEEDSPAILDSFLIGTPLTLGRLKHYLVPVNILESLAHIEQSRPRTRWAYGNHFLESLLAFPFIGHKDINPGTLSKRRHFIQGHGLWMNDPRALRVLYATNGFRQGFEFLLHRGIHFALLGLTAAQFATATSFLDFFDKFWNGDEYAITALAYATSRTESLNGLYALLALPALWGGVKAALFARSAQADPTPQFERVLKTVQDAGSPSLRSWWDDGIRWILPLHSLDPNLNTLVRILRWDGRLTPEQREKGVQSLDFLFKMRGGYTKIVAAFHLAQLADSPHVSELALLERYDERTVAQLLKMKGDSLEEIQRLGKFPTAQWQRASFKEKIELLAHFIYGRYLQWWLGLADTRKESAAFWSFKVAKALVSLTILKTIIQAVVQFSSCPKKQGVSFTGEAPWSSDYSQTCYHAYWDQFNFIAGQPASTLTNILGDFYLPNFGDVLDLAGKGLNGTQVAELLEGFATYQPQLVFRTLNLSGNALKTSADFAAFMPQLGVPYYATLQALDLSKNNVEEFSTDGTVALAERLQFCSGLTFLALSSNAIGWTGVEGIIALANNLALIPNLSIFSLANNFIGNTNTTGTEKLSDNFVFIPHLTALDLSNNDIGYENTEGAIALGKGFQSLSRLVSLNLSGNQIGRRGVEGTVSILQSLQALPCLSVLDLSHAAIGLTGPEGTIALGEALASVPRLTSLDLSKNWIGHTNTTGTVALASGLTSLPKLTFLDLSDNNIGAVGTEGTEALSTALLSLSSLTYLNLQANYMGYTGTLGLQNLGHTLTQLLHLSALYVQQPGPLPGLNELQSFWNHRSLDTDLYNIRSLSDVQAYLTALSPTIQHISLGGMLNNPPPELTFPLFQGLSSFSSLRSLDLSNNCIDCTNAEGTLEIARGLTVLPSLTALNLSGNYIGSIGTKGTVALGEAVSTLSHLTSLDLSQNWIGYTDDAGTTVLGEAVSTLSHLISLDLSQNWIGYTDDAGTTVLGEAVSTLSHLTSLDLSHNQIGRHGIGGTVKIGNSLAFTSFLVSLNLSHNYIGNMGINGTIALARSFSTLTNLRTLNLENNKIGISGTQGSLRILNALAQLPHLQTINLAGMQNVTWTEAANALASFNDQKLRAACQSELCFGTPINGTHRASSWIPLAPLTPPVTSSAASLKPSSLLSLPLYALRFLPDLLSQDKEVEPSIDIRLPEDGLLSITPPRESLRIKRSHALSSGEEETRTVFSSPRLPSYPAHTAVAGGVGLLLLGKGFYDVGKALTQVGRNLWALAVQKYTGQSPEGFLLSGDMRDRKLSKVNALFTSLFAKSRRERYQDTIWAWWLEDHQDEWHRLQRLTFLSRHVLKTFKIKLNQFAQDWELFEQSQQTSSSQEPA